MKKFNLVVMFISGGFIFCCSVCSALVVAFSSTIAILLSITAAVMTLIFSFSIFKLLKTAPVKGKTSEPARLNDEERFIISEKMRTSGTIISRFSHDINNMIHAIMGYCELAMDDEGLSEETQEYMKEMMNSADDADRFIRRVQQFGRKKPISRMDEKIGDLITTAFEQAKMHTGQSAELKVSISPETSTVSCERELLEAAIFQIFTNSMVHNADDPTIISASVSLQQLDAKEAAKLPDIRPGNYAQLILSDNGVGIPPDYRRQIFDPFFSSDKEDSKKGTGLAIAYTAVIRHDGVILLETKDSGAAFKILLPLRDPDDEMEEIPEREAQAETDQSDAQNRAPGRFAIQRSFARSQTRQTVFLVEDNKPVRKQIRILLKNAGFNVLSAGSGEEAMRLYRKKSDEINVCLFDLMLPDMNGIQLYRTISRRGVRKPVLYCTGYDSDFLRSQKALPESARPLQKPFSRQELISRLQTAT